MSGKVYFVSAPGRIKIGFTTKPEKRLIVLRRSDMEELTVIAIIDGSRALERKLHALVDKHRLRGEWFTDCADVREVIADAVAGKHAMIAEPKPAAPDYAIYGPHRPRPFVPEYLIVQKLLDEAEASLARNDDKYETRGHVRSALIAAATFMEQQGIKVGPAPWLADDR